MQLQNIFSKLTKFIKGSKLDDETREQIEEILLEADVGVVTTQKILDNLDELYEKQDSEDQSPKFNFLKEDIQEQLQKESSPLNIQKDRLNIILVLGVNGTGKTTTLGKLAYQMKQQGYKVLLAASDTFRAAADEQLKIWAKRADAQIVSHAEGADPAAVTFDAISAAKSRGMNAILIDTAGRLHTKVNLMEELKKIMRVIKKEIPNAPHETLLVLDANTGQNGLMQAKTFNQELGLSGVVLTKLDGTAKGGVVLSIKQELGIPIKFIGVGEGINDLKVFEPKEFVDNLFE